MTTWTLWIGALLVVGGSAAQLTHHTAVARVLWALAVLAFIATTVGAVTAAEFSLPLVLILVAAVTREPAKAQGQGQGRGRARGRAVITAVCAVVLGALLAGSDLAGRWRTRRSERARIAEIAARLDRFQWWVLEDLASVVRVGGAYAREASARTSSGRRAAIAGERPARSAVNSSA